MSIRPDMEKLAHKLEPSREIPHAVPISHDLAVYYAAIAKREECTLAAVINDVLRKNAEGIG